MVFSAMGMAKEGNRNCISSIFVWANNKLNTFFFFQLMVGLEIDLFLGTWTTLNIKTIKQNSISIYASILLLVFLVVYYLMYVILTSVFGIRRIRSSVKNKGEIVPTKIVR